MVDDCDNDNEGKTKEFFDYLDDNLEWGKTYKLTIEKI